MLSVALSSKDGKCSRDFFHLPAHCPARNLDVGQTSEHLRPLSEGIKMGAWVQAWN